MNQLVCLAEILRPEKDGLPSSEMPAAGTGIGYHTETSARLNVITNPTGRLSVSKVTSRCLTDPVTNTLRPLNRALTTKPALFFDLWAPPLSRRKYVGKPIKTGSRDNNCHDRRRGTRHALCLPGIATP